MAPVRQSFSLKEGRLLGGDRSHKDSGTKQILPAQVEHEGLSIYTCVYMQIDETGKNQPSTAVQHFINFARKALSYVDDPITLPNHISFFQEGVLLILEGKDCCTRDL